MTTETNIPPGAYRLSRDVQNPKPDRRHTRDWRKERIWEQGCRFVVREQRRMGDKHLAEFAAGLEPDVVAELRAKDRYTVVELAGDRYATNHRIGPGDREQYAALAAALVPTEESLSQFMTRIGCENGFMEWLVEHGHVLRSDLELWWYRYQYGEGDDDVDAPAVVTLPVHDEVSASTPFPAPPFVAMPAIPVESGVGAEYGPPPLDDATTVDMHAQRIACSCPPSPRPTFNHEEGCPMRRKRKET